ncbi:hypothetical protein C8F04DRAFT_1088168 [Mycena alexandri]|uniref:SRR1-like domain-containing protein n=1 Tax=Mycena alexandri TaxID=1745969 RepID=A0AAD6XBA9_9AGAR|nr:hypothetical protein C8F04DRAFT_1088168 [Mycena alexandri]
MSRNILVHPGNPSWRLRPHPTSRILTGVCTVHGSSCPDFSAVALHHVPESWTLEERDAHPAWAHDLVDMCRLDSHQCDDVCGLFLTSETSPGTPITVGERTIFDEIAYFHGSKHWDSHWESVPQFSLHADLAHLLTPLQTALVGKHLRPIAEYYNAMDAAGFFIKTAEFIHAVFRSSHPERPTYPTSAFGAGFSGFDRIDERGWDRAGYQSTEDHSAEDWGLRTAYQIAYFVALGRIFQMPAGHMVAYDPCYSIVDVVLLATLGVRALRKGDPGLKRLRKFTNPTLFYAPGAEQHVFTDAIQRADPIAHLVILGGDASWCGTRTKDFTTYYALMHAPSYITTYNNESPCGEDNCLQWIPLSRVEAFNRTRGPATEPALRQMVMPDGSLELDD